MCLVFHLHAIFQVSQECPPTVTLTLLTLCLDWHHGCSSSPTALRFSSGRFFPFKTLCFGKEEDRRCIWTVIKLCKGIFWVCCRWGVLVPFELKQCIYVRRYMLFFVFYLCWAETCGNTALENIAKQDQNLEIQAYADKLSVIKEVLARRHMKVAFFGR